MSLTELEAERARLRGQLLECQRANTEVELRNVEYLIALSAAYNTLQSYAHGNSAPDLAEEIAAHILAIIEKAGGV